MLRDLDIVDVRPTGIMRILAQSIHNIDINDTDAMFEKYSTGIYRHDGFKFNFDKFIQSNCIDAIKDEYVFYGVCDNWEQVVEYHKELLNNPDKNYVIGLSTVIRADESPEGGFRPHRWGPYIGTQKLEHEYLYDDTNVDKVYTYHIYEIY